MKGLGTVATERVQGQEHAPASAVREMQPSTIRGRLALLAAPLPARSPGRTGRSASSTAYSAGGGIDLVARPLREQMKQAFGQTVIVENRPGASAMIAANAVAKAPPDGLTLLMAASGRGRDQPSPSRQPHDLRSGARARPGRADRIVPCVVVVAATTPVNNGAELIAYARANKGKLSFSSSGIGNPQQLAGELMNHMAGTDVLHVPYRGAGARRSPMSRPAR
jgi:tripartite-type tricarboxylate transporter receptor subunit TctC